MIRNKEIIARWKYGRDFYANIISIQGRETFVENECKRDKKVLEISDASSTDENTDSDHPLKTKSLMNESYPLKKTHQLTRKFSRS